MYEEERTIDFPAFWRVMREDDATGGDSDVAAGSGVSGGGLGVNGGPLYEGP
jgi:hypothetical protein